jgi:hypothetical protein
MSSSLFFLAGLPACAREVPHMTAESISILSGTAGLRAGKRKFQWFENTPCAGEPAWRVGCAC